MRETRSYAAEVAYHGRVINETKNSHTYIYTKHAETLEQGFASAVTPPLLVPTAFRFMTPTTHTHTPVYIRKREREREREIGTCTPDGAIIATTCGV